MHIIHRIRTADRQGTQLWMRSGNNKSICPRIMVIHLAKPLSPESSSIVSEGTTMKASSPAFPTVASTSCKVPMISSSSLVSSVHLHWLIVHAAYLQTTCVSSSSLITRAYLTNCNRTFALH